MWRQIDEATPRSPSEKDLRTLSAKLLRDPKEARERLNQSPTNSSRPPSSRAPWEKLADSGESDTPKDEVDAAEVDIPEVDVPDDDETVGDSGDDKSKAKNSGKPSRRAGKPKRKPGRQPGSRGFGRTQRIAITNTVEHRPDTCALCGGKPERGGAAGRRHSTVSTSNGEKVPPSAFVS
jgi:transposase